MAPGPVRDSLSLVICTYVHRNEHIIYAFLIIFTVIRVSQPQYLRLMEICRGKKNTYTYIHTYIHAYIHTYIHTCMHTYIHTYTTRV